MSVNRLGEYLNQMIEATQQACAYIDGMTQSEFLTDKKTQQAIILNRVILGESATRILKDHAEIVDKYPAILWRNMKGVRNRVAHGYFDINLEVVWETAKTALPRLLEQLPSIRANIQ